MWLEAENKPNCIKFKEIAMVRFIKKEREMIYSNV